MHDESISKHVVSYRKYFDCAQVIAYQPTVRVVNAQLVVNHECLPTTSRCMVAQF